MFARMPMAFAFHILLTKEMSVMENREHLDLSGHELSLIERIDALVGAASPPLVWGHPRLGATPKSVAIHELAVRTEGVEQAIREIALEVQRLLFEVQELADQS